MRSVLILAAHPDDEVLGCGGTIAKLSDGGVDVHVAFLADGVFSRIGNDRATQQLQLNARRIAAKKACEILGIRSVTFGDFPDNQLDTISLLEIIQAVELIIDRHKPDTVFMHHFGDLNIDHRRLHEAAVTACRPQSGHSVKTILSYEVPSSTEWQLPGNGPAFTPNWFVDITDTLHRKLTALEVYSDELRPWPHPRSLKAVEHLASWRGASVGVDSAEAFILGRQLL